MVGLIRVITKHIRLSQVKRVCDGFSTVCDVKKSEILKEVTRKRGLIRITINQE